jgi:heat shock protein HslJ
METHFILFCLCFTMISCAPKIQLSNTAPAAANGGILIQPQTTIKAKWVLVSIEGLITEKELEERGITKPFLVIEDKISGYTGCNNMMGGSAEIIKNSIKFSAMATTKKMCMGKANEIEGRFLAILQKATRFELNSVTLVLFEEEKKLATFKAAN